MFFCEAWNIWNFKISNVCIFKKTNFKIVEILKLQYFKILTFNISNVWKFENSNVWNLENLKLKHFIFWHFKLSNVWNFWFFKISFSFVLKKINIKICSVGGPQFAWTDHIFSNNDLYSRRSWGVPNESVGHQRVMPTTSSNSLKRLPSSRY